MTGVEDVHLGVRVVVHREPQPWAIDAAQGLDPEYPASCCRTNLTLARSIAAQVTNPSLRAQETVTRSPYDVVVPDLDDIAWLRDNSPAWRLLRADNAPLVLSFLHQVFVADNIRSISATELASRLDDELYTLNQREHDQREGKRYPKSARAYLDDWAAPGAGWLRKYYPDATDEPHFDATPAVEKALQWVKSLRQRDFVGTESRLNVIVELLRQIVFGTETDPSQRLAELRRQRQQIDEQIARVQSGELPVSCRCSTRPPCVRPLYVPVRKPRIVSDNVEDADEETDPSALFEQVYVDPEPLRGGIRQARAACRWH